MTSCVLGTEKSFFCASAAREAQDQYEKSMPVARCKDHDEDDDDGNHLYGVTTPPPGNSPGKGIGSCPALHDHCVCSLYSDWVWQRQGLGREGGETMMRERNSSGHLWQRQRSTPWVARKALVRDSHHRTNDRGGGLCIQGKRGDHHEDVASGCRLCDRDAFCLSSFRSSVLHVAPQSLRLRRL